MRLHRIVVEDVRGLTRACVELAPAGVTVIEAPNESGKSTLLDAVDVLLKEKDSTRKQPVRELQPVGRDVGSFVEVELSCGAVHLTVRKRFNRQTMTELQVHAPEPRQLTGDDAHGHLRELLEQHADLDLYEALRFRQGRDLDSIALGESGSLARRLDEIAGGTGDAGDDALLDRIRREFERYFTPKGHDGKDLRAADAAVEAARVRREEFATTARELADDVERIEELEREQHELGAALTRLEPELEEHRERRGRVDRLREQLDLLRVRAEAACADLERRRETLDERRATSERVETIEAEVAADEPLVRRERERLTTQRERLADLTGAATAAERQEAAARQARDGARDRVELGRRRQQLEALRARQRRIRQADEDAHAAAVALETHPLEPAQLAAVRDADEAVRVAEARLGDAAPVVTVGATRELEVELDAGTRMLEAGERFEQRVPATWALTLPGHLEVTVRAGTSLADRQDELAGARERLAGACRELGVADRAGAERLAEQQRSHRRALEERDVVVARELEGRTREELDELVRDRSTRQEALEARLRAREQQETPQLLPDVDADEGQLERLEAAETRSRAAAEQARRERDTLASGLRELESRVTVAETELAGRRRECEQLRARLESERQHRSDAALEQDAVTAEEAERAARDEVTRTRDELEALGADEVELLADNHEQRVDGTRERLEQVRGELMKLQLGVELRGGEGIGEALQLAEVELERARERTRRLRSRATAAATLLDTFVQARDEAYTAYREPLRERIVRAGRVVFGDDLDVQLDEHLAVVGRSLGGTWLSWEQLSAGAREQLAILTALAAADLAGGDGTEGVPLVLDDALGYTDPGRLERLGAVLGAVRGPQVLVLTCVGERFRAIGGARVVRLRESVGG
jgi:DNA repair exonuclease SbcCD ATPase subunit